MLLQAEEFRTAVHMLLEWLSEAEQSLRFRGALPDDAEALQALIDAHKVKHNLQSTTQARFRGGNVQFLSNSFWGCRSS